MPENLLIGFLVLDFVHIAICEKNKAICDPPFVDRLLDFPSVGFQDIYQNNLHKWLSLDCSIRSPTYVVS